MTYDLLLSDTFKANILREMEYLSSCTSEAKAQETLGAILKRLDALRDFPYLGTSPISPELRNWGARVIIFDRYLVFYKVNEVAKCVVLTFFIPAKTNYLWQIHL
jgi:plasmid stabilization system protein ParE